MNRINRSSTNKTELLKQLATMEPLKQPLNQPLKPEITRRLFRNLKKLSQIPSAQTPSPPKPSAPNEPVPSAPPPPIPSAPQNPSALTQQENPILVRPVEYIATAVVAEPNTDETIVKKNENNDSKQPVKKDKETVYFNDYIPVFKLSLQYLTYLSIVMVLFILLLSIVAFLKLIYDIIANIIYLFINTTTANKAFSLDFLSMSIIKCTKDNFDQDRFFILTGGKQNITLFNIGVYIIYLLLIYVFLYFVLLLLAKMNDKIFEGNINEIDNSGLFLILIGIILLYSGIYLMIYKFIFKIFVYNSYYSINNEHTNIDRIISNYILIKDNSGNILIDENFFIILFDPSRIDEINEIFKQEIITKNKNNCLEQKIVIYNIYNYLREYIIFDDKMKEDFKNYCTSEAEDKPVNENGMKITFISLLNNNEIKMIKKYNEDLPYFNDIPDANLEYFNEHNKRINYIMKDINSNILIKNSTSIPFFFTIIYIISILLLSILVVYIITVTVLSADLTKVSFNKYIYLGLEWINKNIFLRIINYMFKNK